MMPDFPEAVSNAIAAVMADIPKLEREETNKHANYKFASIDDFLDAVRWAVEDAEIDAAERKTEGTE